MSAYPLFFVLYFWQFGDEDPTELLEKSKAKSALEKLQVCLLEVDLICTSKSKCPLLRT